MVAAWRRSNEAAGSSAAGPGSCPVHFTAATCANCRRSWMPADGLRLGQGPVQDGGPDRHAGARSVAGRCRARRAARYRDHLCILDKVGTADVWRNACGP